MQLQTHDAHCAIGTNKEHFATAFKLSTLCSYKQMKQNMQLQTNEVHYETAKKLIALCKCNPMKLTMQLQTNEAHYVIEKMQPTTETQTN